MSATVVNPKDTDRAEAYELWMQAPQPMVTMFATLDVTRLWRKAKREGLKFNMLMCWCIGRAASRVEQFRMLPVGKDLVRYDRLGINVIVVNKSGGINTCDVPFSEDLRQFNRDYLALTRQVHDSCTHYDISADAMIIGTSALVETHIDGVVGMYSGIYNNPFLFWGAVGKHCFKRRIKLSFQFHHTQMDGLHAGRFLRLLQEEVRLAYSDKSQTKE